MVKVFNKKQVRSLIKKGYTNGRALGAVYSISRMKGYVIKKNQKR